MPTLDDARALLVDEHGLAVVSTAQSDGRVLSSVVNAGVMAHPATGRDVIAFVSGGSAARLGHVRRGSEVTVAIRRGWRWVGVTGRAVVLGPDDPADGVDIPMLLREVFRAAGGTHDDWDEYDRVMAEDRRAAVFVEPDRLLGNG
jgi:PPOX class probable F420-dependent enzyme